MTYEMYNIESREVEKNVNSLEEGLKLILDSTGEYELIINDIKESDIFEISKDSLLNTYIPEPVQLGFIIHSSAFGWKINLYVDDRIVDSGSYYESIFKEAKLQSKENLNKLVKLRIWAVNGQGIPLGIK